MSYNWEGMKKITYGEAKRLYNNGYTVFRLYDDDTEGEVVDMEDLEQHNSYGGEFGIEKATCYERLYELLNNCIEHFMVGVDVRDVINFLVDIIGFNTEELLEFGFDIQDIDEGD